MLQYVCFICTNDMKCVEEHVRALRWRVCKTIGLYDNACAAPILRSVPRKKVPRTLYFVTASARDVEKSFHLQKPYVWLQYEQICQNERYKTVEFQNILKGALWVWDYSQTNMDVLKKMMGKSCPPLSLVRITPNKNILFTDYKSTPKEDEVLFVGQLTSHERIQCVKILTEKFNLPVRLLHNCFGKEREAFIRKAKVCINIHHHRPATLEVARLHLLLQNRSVVVSEDTSETAVINSLDDAVVFVPSGNFDLFGQTCADFFNDKEKRERQLEKVEKYLNRNENVLFSISVADTLQKTFEKMRKEDLQVYCQVVKSIQEMEEQLEKVQVQFTHNLRLANNDSGEISNMKEMSHIVLAWSSMLPSKQSQNRLFRCSQT